MNVDWKAFQQAHELADKIIDLIRNHKAEAALHGLLVAVVILRRKTTMNLAETVGKLSVMETIFDAFESFKPKA